jgi:hypothetical protein
MTSKMAFGAWSFGVMGASIFTFIWLVSIMHNVDRSWAFHSVDHSLVLAMDEACAGSNPPLADFVEELNGHAVGEFDAPKYAGAHVTNASCVAAAVDKWQETVVASLDNSPYDKPRITFTGIADGAERENYFAYASLQDYENGANTSVITALVFVSVAMIVGVANFIVLLVSSKRYTMLESLFCFCSGFGSVIVIASPWISDVILTTAGAEFVALPVIVAFQITLLWVRPGATDDIEQSDGFMF